MRNTFLICCLLLFGCQSKENSTQENSAVPVLAVKPIVKNVPIYIESIGLLTPSIFIEISPQISGRVTDVMIKEGQWIEKGAPLFTVDPQSQAGKVQEAKAQLALDNATLQAIQKKLDRFKMLAEKDLIAQTEWDELEMQGLQAQATIEIDSAKLHAATFNQLQCTSFSPIDGRVGKLDLHPGTFVNAGKNKSLVTISKMNPLIVEFSITEKEFATASFTTRSKNSHPLEIQPLCSPQPYTKGSITFLDNHFDHKSGLLLIKGEIANSQYTLRPGQAVRVRVPITTIENAKLIPQRAIKYNQQGPYVYVVLADNTVGQRQITLGDDLGTDIIVKEGLDSEESVITDGHLRLSPGVKVRL